MEKGNATAVRSGATCMFCIPLRLGIFINAIGTIIGSCFMIGMKHEFEENMRIFGGGYVLLSRVIIGFIELTGCVWGIIGAMGAWQCKERFLEIYNNYQMIRVAAWLGMYVTDGPVLWNCELWMTDIQAAIKSQGYNPIMYKIALEGRCAQERFYFFFFSSIGLMFFIYLTRINQVYQEMLAAEPAYLLRVPKYNAGGAFHAESLGERRYLLSGAEGKGDQPKPVWSKDEVGPAIHAPKSGVEPNVPKNYGGPQAHWGGNEGFREVKKTPWDVK